MKNVIKEICIGILVFIAVMLLLAIIFYDYVPINKVIPNKVAYTVPDNVKVELNEDVTIQNSQPQKITYSVTSSDLQQYQSATVYQPGNPNPFQAYSTGRENAIVDGTPSSTSAVTSNTGIQYYYPQTSSTK